MFTTKTHTAIIALVASAGFAVSSLAPAVSQAGVVKAQAVQPRVNVQVPPTALTPTPGELREFPLPAGPNLIPRDPLRITKGPDGNMWFTEPYVDRIGRITPSGTLTEFSSGITPGSEPDDIAAGPDGNLWFTEEKGNRIGRITPSGVVTEFPVPTAGSHPRGIAAGPDGNMWFTEFLGGKIGRIIVSGTLPESSTNRALLARTGFTRTGQVTEFSSGITAESGPSGITKGADGNMWFTEETGNAIGRITPAGAVTQFGAHPVNEETAEGALGVNSFPTTITPGPEGNLWFTESFGNRVGRISTSGAVTEFSGLPPESTPDGIVAGPDGDLWVTESRNSGVARMTRSGQVIGFYNTTGFGEPRGIAAGPNNTLWFTEFGGDRVARITFNSPASVLAQ
jgi:streptogramin lyase